jgi:hypothetical protein
VRFVRTFFGCSFLLGGASMLASACGGAVAPLGGDAGGGGGSSGSGASGSDSSSSSSNGRNCQVDGVPCLDAAQCCTGVCSGGACGGAVADASPPPPVCNVGWSANACDVCLTSQCCQYVSLCQQDAACAQEHACFDQCKVAGGTGSTCWTQCQNTFGSNTGNGLLECGVTYCAAECDQ